MTYEIAGSRVLITGGAGFVGSHIADALLDEGAAEIITLDNLIRGRRENLEPSMLRGSVRPVEGDIRDQELVRRLMDGVDYVYHEAALRITHCAEDPRQAFGVMYEGTFNVLEAARQSKVKKIVAASSASVYGEPSYQPIDEAHPYNNRTLYGAAKIADEHMLRAFNDMYGLPYVALRYFNVYGPRMDIHGVYTEVLIRWMDRIEHSLPPLIFGDGTQSMDFVYVTDVARANIAALRADETDTVFNVATGVETTLTELSQTLCEVMGRPDLKAEYQEERKVNPVRHRLGSTALAQEKLGFVSMVEVRHGLEQLLEWRKSALSATGATL
jgi:UDP-glucose 4-epimerase